MKFLIDECLHTSLVGIAKLIVIVPQVLPDRQRALFDAVLDEIGAEEPVNEVIEVELEDGTAVITRYELPETGA